VLVGRQASGHTSPRRRRRQQQQPRPVRRDSGVDLNRRDRTKAALGRTSDGAVRHGSARPSNSGRRYWVDVSVCTAGNRLQDRLLCTRPSYVRLSVGVARDPLVVYVRNAENCWPIRARTSRDDEHAESRCRPGTLSASPEDR
jgi:hypothetical protein